MEAKEVYSGTVISWFTNSGYGFIECEDKRTFFLHIKDTLNRDVPEPGMVIRFILGDYNGRMVAKQVDK